MHNKNKIISEKRKALKDKTIRYGLSIVALVTDDRLSPTMKSIQLNAAKAIYESDCDRIRHALPDNSNILDITMMGTSYAYTLPVE